MSVWVSLSNKILSHQKWLGQVFAHLTIWLLPPRETLCETLLFLLIYDSLARKPVFGIFPSFQLLWTSFTWIILSCTLATSNFDVLSREGVFEGFPELLAEISCNHPMRLSFTWSKYIVNISAKIFCLLVEVAPALTALLTIWWFRLALSGNWAMFYIKKLYPRYILLLLCTLLLTTLSCESGIGVWNDIGYPLLTWYIYHITGPNEYLPIKAEIT